MNPLEWRLVSPVAFFFFPHGAQILFVESFSVLATFSVERYGARQETQFCTAVG